jgi:exodeoxyribonuclease VII small subunit
MKKNTTEHTAEPRSYEDALARLEQIVTHLDQGDVPLEELLALYDEAIKLTTYCRTKLADAEARLEVLMETADGGTRVEPLSE